MSHWFLPEMPDLLGLMARQAEVTTEGIEHFVAWSKGDAATERRVRDSEHAADEARRAVNAALRTAFTTPLDPEDIYELCERMDTVMNAAKNIVREAEVIDLQPDEQMGEMAEKILEGQEHLQRAVAAIGHDDDLATAESDAAVKSVRDLERIYRSAMSLLLDDSDLREVTGRRELYRRYSRAGDRVEAVAERVWYAVVKSP